MSFLWDWLSGMLNFLGKILNIINVVCLLCFHFLFYVIVNVYALSRVNWCLQVYIKNLANCYFLA